MNIRPSGENENRVDISLRKEEIKGVKTYGKVDGAIARLFGVAAKVIGDDNKTYCVNIRSLGKHWSSEKTQNAKEPSLSTDQKEKVTTRMMKSFEKFFSSRKDNFDLGESIVLHNTISDNKESTAFIINDRIKGLLSKISTKDKDKILTIISELKMDKSNLDKVLFDLKSELESFNTDYNSAFNFLFDDKLTEFGKLHLLKSFQDAIPNLKDKDGVSKPSNLSKKEVRERKKDVATQIKTTTDKYLLNGSSSMPGIKRVHPKQNQIIENISSLRYDQSNLDSVFMEVITLTYSPEAISESLQQFCTSTTPSEKLQFLNAIKETIGRKPFKEAAFLQSLKEKKLHSLLPSTPEKESIFSAGAQCFDDLMNSKDEKYIIRFRDFFDSFPPSSNVSLQISAKSEEISLEDAEPPVFGVLLSKDRTEAGLQKKFIKSDMNPQIQTSTPKTTDEKFTDLTTRLLEQNEKKDEFKKVFSGIQTEEEKSNFILVMHQRLIFYDSRKA